MAKSTNKEKTTVIGAHTAYLAQESDLPKAPAFVGREDELRLCRVAWGLDESYRFLESGESNHLAFRLYGSPGMGKNELVYELVRRIRLNNPTILNLPFYSMVGHDEMSPEDMVLTVVPTESSGESRVRMVLRASPLASAIRTGGIFFFDELNRLPERALAPLAPALDGRGMLFAASSGIWVEPAKDAFPFRFCCALNPSAGGDLPAYIDQRTLPKIRVDYPGHDGLVALLRAQLRSELKPGCAEGQGGQVSAQPEIVELNDQIETLRRKLYDSGETPSVRQGLTAIRLSRALVRERGESSDFAECLELAFEHVFPERIATTSN
jgi:MoxR-like ATPase